MFERLSRGISEGRWHELADLYAEDTVVDQPFLPGGHGHIEGREAIRAHFAGAPAMGVHLAARDVVVHETADPEVVIAEYTYDITVGENTATTANIQVLRVRDGLIVESRDYHDHAAMARLIGQVPEPVAGGSS